MPAATAAERIVWPAAFGRRFIVFVDVEEEFDWNAPFNRAHVATTAMRAFSAAHRRFADRGVGLACMVDYPIATDPAAVAILQRALEDGRSSIGAQLHAWVNPPFAELEKPASTYPGNLSLSAEAAKLDRLTEAIEAAFGRRPVSYRAGRYGIGPHTLKLLAARGYRLDGSVRAGYDYSGDGGPDFTAMGSHAFRREGVLELPLTTAFVGAGRAGGAALHRRLGRIPFARSTFARLRLLERIALTPEDMPLPAALRAIDRALEDGVRVLSLSFHSPSLEPGHTPYVRSAADLAGFHRWWNGVLAHLARQGVQATTPDELLAAAASGSHV